MDGLPVVVRLLDPPLHEFLPDLVELSTAAAVADDRGTARRRPGAPAGDDPALARVNPMLGLRGVRLLTVLPEIIDAQVRALREATDHVAGRRPRRAAGAHGPVGRRRRRADGGARAHGGRSGRGRQRRTAPRCTCPIGVMIELPRAALTRGGLAEHADFFSFGTNDLTQTTWGMSRDDAEANFLAAYREAGILATDPFKTLDEAGVARSSSWPRVRAAAPDPGWGSARAASTPATLRRSGSSPARAWTTCPAHPRASRSCGSRPAVRPSLLAGASPSTLGHAMRGKRRESAAAR